MNKPNGNSPDMSVITPKVFNSFAEWKAARPEMKGTLGLVPTMGALHEGHLSLVRRAREENDLVVVWIFVNPKQFPEKNDFSSYPRDLQLDLKALEGTGTDFVLAPQVEDVYPSNYQTYVDVEDLSQPLEGAHRAGHFRGVATVVTKMFCLTRCDRAYFGQKDAQQTLVVKRMVEDLCLPLEVVICPTIREPDGLAMSSRNLLLSREHRQASPIVYRALMDVEAAVKCGERNGEKLRQIMLKRLAKEPLANVEYVSLADPATLKECDQVTDGALASLAVRFGNIRLIDNLIINLS